MVQCTRCDARLLPALMKKHEAKHDEEEQNSITPSQTDANAETPGGSGRTKRQAAAR